MRTHTQIHTHTHIYMYSVYVYPGKIQKIKIQNRENTENYRKKYRTQKYIGNILTFQCTNKCRPITTFGLITDYLNETFWK